MIFFFFPFLIYPLLLSRPRMLFIAFLIKWGWVGVQAMGVSMDGTTLCGFHFTGRYGIKEFWGMSRPTCDVAFFELVVGFTFSRQVRLVREQQHCRRARLSVCPRIFNLSPRPELWRAASAYHVALQGIIGLYFRLSFSLFPASEV